MGALLDAFPQAMALVLDPYTLGVGLLATTVAAYRERTVSMNQVQLAS